MGCVKKTDEEQHTAHQVGNRAVGERKTVKGILGRGVLFNQVVREVTAKH